MRFLHKDIKNRQVISCLFQYRYAKISCHVSLFNQLDHQSLADISGLVC